ncbi:MAG: TonB family protein, partial [Psychrobacter sp.]
GSNSPSSTGAGKQNTGGNNGGNGKEKKPAVDPGPVSFGSGEASWRSPPRLDFLAKERRLKDKGNISVTAAITVDKKGNITQASISPSTGVSSVDRKIIRAIKNAKLTPFIRNGVAVRGRVSVSLRYVIP